MLMKDNRKNLVPFYSLSKGDICLHNGEAYMCIDSIQAVLLTDVTSPNDIEVGDIVELDGLMVEKVLAKILIENEKRKGE